MPPVVYAVEEAPIRRLLATLENERLRRRPGLGRPLRDRLLAPSLRWNGNVWIRADCRAFRCTPVRTTLNAAMPDSVDALLTRSAARRTDRPALIVDVHRWDFAELKLCCIIVAVGARRGALPRQFNGNQGGRGRTDRHLT